MCGILFANYNADVSRVADFMRHRGLSPVDVYAKRGYLFAHALLPVQGDAPVHQPVFDDEHVLLFSGELWRHVERSDTRELFTLLRAACIFKDKVEAVSKVLDNLRGMFALVFQQRDVTLFASDFFGEAPLYFAQRFSRIAVATEMKQLVALGFTLKEIRACEPATLYTFDGVELTADRYARVEYKNDSTDLDREHLRSLVSRAVEERYKANTLQRSALLLSGGLDSTIMAYELSRLGLRDCYTVAVSEDSHDVRNAREIAARFNLNHKFVRASELDTDATIAVVEHSNRSIVEEFACHVALSNALARDEVRVVYLGSGADEMFVGYSHLLRHRSAQTRKTLQKDFVESHHKLDLRAYNKVFALNAIEARSPFLSREILEYASTLDVDSLLVGKHREMKLALRLAYEDVLGLEAHRPKLIARETMGAKAHFEKTLGDSPLIYRSRFKELFANADEVLKLVKRAKTLA